MGPAASLLATRGISIRVLSMPSLRPFDGARVITEAKRTGRLVTLEEHGPGGLGAGNARHLVSRLEHAVASAVRWGTRDHGGEADGATRDAGRAWARRPGSWQRASSRFAS